MRVVTLKIGLTRRTRPYTYKVSSKLLNNCYVTADG